MVGDVEFDVAAIDAIEAVTKHDVIAFLTWVAEQVGEEARFMHQGMTSSDVLDTCLAVQLTRAADILLADLDALLAAIEAAGVRAQIHADHRPQPRHPRRADHLRAEAGAGLCRVRPRRGRGWSRRGPRSRPARSRARSGPSPTSTRAVEAHVAEAMGLARRADLDPGDPARPARDVLRDAGRDRVVDRAAGDRDPPPAAHRGAGGRGVFRARAEGLVGDAAQAQPGADART